MIPFGYWTNGFAEIHDLHFMKKQTIITNLQCKDFINKNFPAITFLLGYSLKALSNCAAVNLFKRGRPRYQLRLLGVAKAKSNTRYTPSTSGQLKCSRLFVFPFKFFHSFSALLNLVTRFDPSCIFYSHQLPKLCVCGFVCKCLLSPNCGPSALC